MYGLDICWQPPLFRWTKVNIGGSCIGSSSVRSVVGVFHNSHWGFLRGFLQTLGHASVLVTELSATMFAIEKAEALRFCNVCIESDSLQLFNAFNPDNRVSWQIRNWWNNCKEMMKGMNTICTHIPREGNQVTNALAKNGHDLPRFTSQWWNDPPLFLNVLLYRDSIR